MALRNWLCGSFRGYGSGSHRGRTHRKFVAQPFTAFVDDRFPGPGSHVSAYRLDTAISLNELRQRLVELGCPTSMWQRKVLLCGSSAQLGQQRCSAVFFPDGCVVCWHMSHKTERIILRLAISTPTERLASAYVGDMEAASPRVKLNQIGIGMPIASERLKVTDAPVGVITALDPHVSTLRLTRDPSARISQQLGVSLALAVTVRLNPIEKRVGRQWELQWRQFQHSKIANEIHRTMNLKHVSDRIFVAERGIHELRYELNSKDGCVDAPDLLWGHVLAERLYDQVVAHYDVRRRTALLNERLNYSLDYLHTLGEHVRHQYSVRLEVMIIVLIVLELGVGVAHTHLLG